jgi:hypothetical protein
MDSAIVTLIAIGFLSTFTLSALFVEVAKEDAKRAATASEEMWARTLDYYRNDERASRDGLTRSESRIGHTGPTTNNTRSLWD